MKKIVAFLLCFTLIFCISATAFASDPQIPLGTRGYIKGDLVHLRETPEILSENENSIGLVKENDQFWYQGYGGEASGYEWYHVYMGTGDWAGYFGYVARDFVKWSR